MTFARNAASIVRVNLGYKRVRFKGLEAAVDPTYWRERSGSRCGCCCHGLRLLRACVDVDDDRARLPARAGVLTPVTAFGEVLAERVRGLGMTLTVG